MRNNPKDIVINHLIEKQYGPKTKSRVGMEIETIVKHEETMKKIRKFRQKLAKVEESGQYVEVRKGMRVLVKAGENVEEKIAAYMRRLQDAEKSGRILTHGLA